MAFDRIIKRYSAYYSGWCVAFGEHEIAYDEDRDINWLHGESKIGITLAPRLKRILVHELLGKHREKSKVVLADSFVRINEIEYRFESETDKQEMNHLKEFFCLPDDIHMFLTNHFCYPPGTKIITFSTKKPLLIMYKEIESLDLQII